MGDDRGYWCRCCQTRYVGPLTEWGKPHGWYKILKAGEAPAFGSRDMWPGWYCSIDCILLVGMLAVGVDEQAAVAWIRGEEAVTSG